MKRYAFLALAVLLLPLSAGAMTFQAGDSLSFPGSAPIEENTYAVGGTIYSSEQFPADFFAAGGTLNTYGRVAGDATFLGGTVITNSEVGGDLRVAGGNVTVGGKVGGELLAAGGTVVILPGASLDGDIAIAGGAVTINSDVGGKLLIRGGEVRINGLVARDVDVRADKVTLGPRAIIEGDFVYASRAAAVVEAGAVVRGETKFSELPAYAKQTKTSFLSGLLVAWLFKVLMIFVAAMILRAIVKDRPRLMLKLVKDKFWRELGIGFAMLILVPIGAFILLATIIGILPGIAALMLYGILLVLAFPIASLWLAELMSGWWKGKAAWYVVLLAAAILSLLGWVPVVGWILGFIILLLTLGSTVDFLRSSLKLK